MNYIKTAESIGLLSPREYTEMESKFMDRLLSPRYAEFIRIRNKIRKELQLNNKLESKVDYLKQLYDKVTESGSGQ